MMDEKLSSQNDMVAHAIMRMEQVGLNYGSFFKTEFLKEIAGPWAEEKAFPFFMMSLIAQLRQRGFFLTSAQLRGEGWRVAQQVENYHATEAWKHKALRCYDYSVVLLSNTRRDQMTEAEKTRDANALRQLIYERRMLARSNEAVTVLRKHKPGFFKPDIETKAEIEAVEPGTAQLENIDEASQT